MRGAATALDVTPKHWDDGDDEGHLHRIDVQAKAVTIGDTYTVTGLLSPPDGYHLSGGKETS